MKTKEICNDNEATVQYDWNRSSYCNPKPQLISTPTNFSPNGDGVEDEYCIEVCGADEYAVEIIDIISNTTIFFSGVTAIDNSNICIWDGGNSVSASYQVKLTLYACGNIKSVTPYSITLAR